MNNWKWGLLAGGIGAVGCVQGDLVIFKLPGPGSSNSQQKEVQKPTTTQPEEDQDERPYFWFEFPPEGKTDVPRTDRTGPYRVVLPTNRIHHRPGAYQGVVDGAGGFGRVE